MSSESQLDLARAVARGRRARLLNADNTAGASVRLEDAVASGQAYFVVPRPDLLVVDCDLTGDPSRSADRAAAFDLLAEAAERCGLAQVTVASGSPGHRHGYLLTGPGPSRPAIERWCRDRGLDVRDRGVRPPGSPHRDGQHVAAVISPSDPRRALAVLSGPVDTDAAALAERLGMSVPSVRYHLRKLSAAGLMRRAGRMWRHALSAVRHHRCRGRARGRGQAESTAAGCRRAACSLATGWCGWNASAAADAPRPTVTSLRSPAERRRCPPAAVTVPAADVDTSHP